MRAKFSLCWRASKVLLVVAGCLLSAGMFLSFGLVGEPKLADAVRDIEVTLQVSKDGDDLAEVIGLDLGLGVPLWLAAETKEPRPPLPFGGVPSAATAKEKVSAGETATFTFRADADKSGHDALLTTSQLLAGVKVDDLTRIGFVGLPKGNWKLAGYEVKVNGKVLAAEKDLDLSGKAALAKAADRLADLGPKAGPLTEERKDLIILVQTKLASEEETKRLAEVEKELAEAGPERVRLQRIVEGQYPWHVKVLNEAKEQAPKIAALTVVTDTHEQADTKNHVFFRVGGRRYLIGGPEMPLTSRNGPQTIILDLVGVPLRSEDLRDYGLGMLAAPVGWVGGPDRWHPRRVKLEVDGRVVYDSEEVELDRRSLEAIRLIPQKQLDKDRKPVENVASGREVYAWIAGKGQGLDGDKAVALTGKIATETGDVVDTSKPVPAVVTPEPTKIMIGDKEIEVQPPQRAEAAPGELLPGEVPPILGGATGGGGTVQGSGGAGGGFPGGAFPGGGGGGFPGGGGSPDGGGIPGGEGIPGGGGAANDPGKGLPPDEPKASGKPIQITKVELPSLSPIPPGFAVLKRTYSVTWEVTGDEKDVDHYEVFIDQVDVAEVAGTVAKSTKLGDVKPGGRSLVAEGEAIDGFFAIRVKAELKMDIKGTPNEKKSAVQVTATKPAFPPLSTLVVGANIDATNTFQALEHGVFTTHRGMLIGNHWDMPTGFTGKVKLPASKTTKTWGFQYNFATLPESVPSHFFVAFEGGPAPANKLVMQPVLIRFRTRNGGKGADKIYGFKASRSGQPLTPLPAKLNTLGASFVIDGNGPPIKLDIAEGQNVPFGIRDFTGTDGVCVFGILTDTFEGDATRPPILFGFGFRGNP